MVSKILQKLKEKQKGLVIVHNTVAFYSDFSDSNNHIEEALEKIDFDNYLLSFAFLKNLSTSVSILKNNVTAIILVEDQVFGRAEFDHLKHLFGILHLKKFTDAYIASIIGFDLNTPEPTVFSDDKATFDMKSDDLDYKKIVKKFPQFNPNRIQISGAILFAIILFTSSVVVSAPDIHADLILMAGDVLTDAGQHNRAFQLCDDAFWMSIFDITHKQRYDCKIKFLSNFVNPSDMLFSIDEFGDKQLVEDLIAYGDTLVKEHADNDSNTAFVYYESARYLVVTSDEIEDDDYVRRTVIRTDVGMGNILTKIDPSRAMLKFDSVLKKTPDDLSAKIGKTYALQVFADSKKTVEPDVSKENYQKAMIDYVNILNKVTKEKLSPFTDDEIYCSLDFDDSSLKHKISVTSLINSHNSEMKNVLRGIADTCYGLISLENNDIYKEIHKSTPMKIFDSILLKDDPSEIKSLTSKTKMLSDNLKFYYKHNDFNDNPDHQTLLEDIIDSYETVLDKEPNNKFVIKDLVLLFSVNNEEQKKQSMLDKLKNVGDKSDALIHGILLFTESGKCDKANEFYNQVKSLIKTQSILTYLKQINSNCVSF